MEEKVSEKFEADDLLNVDYINGVIDITNKRPDKKKSNLKAYAGLGKGLWGNTPEEVDATIRNLRDSWER